MILYVKGEGIYSAFSDKEVGFIMVEDGITEIIIFDEAIEDILDEERNYDDLPIGGHREFKFS